jgi:F-type H+-transporting ATPase subunit b
MLHARFTLRIHWFVLLAILAAGIAAAPVYVAAQQTAPASSPALAAASQGAPNAASSEEAKDVEVTQSDEQAELDVYRHAPIVHTLAKMLHMKLETTARLFEAINFVIIALAIVIPLVKILPKVLRKRSQTIQHSIESARKMTADANTRLAAVEAQLAKLDAEIAAMRTHVEEESKQDEVRIKAAIEEESSRIVAAAEQEIGMAAAQAKRGLRSFAADLAIERAAQQLVLTAETDRALITEFIHQTTGNGAGKGGKN